MANMGDFVSPNDIKTLLENNDFSAEQIDYAIYGGHINWRDYIGIYVYGITYEIESISITHCIRCDKDFFGNYNICPAEDCGGGVNWRGYYGYSRTETINKLRVAGFLQEDIDWIMNTYEYGHFIDEMDFSDCIVVE